MSEQHYCTMCERFIDPTGMMQITQWTQRNNKYNTAIFLDKKAGLSHSLLNEKMSEKYRPENKVEQVTFVHHPQPEIETPPTPSQAVVEETSSAVASQSSPVADSEAAADEEDEWMPEPHEWYDAIVSVVGQDYFFASLENGEQVFIPAEKITNFPHGHQCVVERLDDVVLRMERNDRPDPRWKALECQLTKTYIMLDEEGATVLRWGEGYGQVIRDCGCWMFVADRSADLLEGEVVVISQWAPSNRDRGTIATRVRRLRSVEDSDDGDEVIRV